MTVVAAQSPRITRKIGNLSYIRGNITIAGGTGSEVLVLPVAAPADAQLFISRHFLGGTPGIAAGAWVFATQTITITSVGGADASAFQFILVW
jgi:hypothetical protein